jgi:pyruvate/2-oxoglutarate dehydrogenase complex dihydrolipoamide dehydrogenase (E3) component
MLNTKEKLKKQPQYLLNWGCVNSKKMIRLERITEKITENRRKGRIVAGSRG